MAKKKKNGIAGSFDTAKTAKSEQSASGTGSGSQEVSGNKGTSTTSNVFLSRGSSTQSGTSNTSSSRSSSGTSSRSNSNTSSDTTDTSTRRRTSTVTVPTTSAQDRNKWREIANWLTSPVGAAVGGGNSALGRNNPMQDLLPAAAKGYASSMLGAYVTPMQGMQNITNWEGRREADTIAQEQDYNALISERDMYVEESRRYGYEPDAAVLADYNARIEALNPENLRTADEYRADAEAALGITRAARDRLQQESAELTNAGARRIEEIAPFTAKETPQILKDIGMNTVADVLASSGVSTLQTFGDAVASLGTGGVAMVPMAIRMFGGEAAEAEREGASVSEQIRRGTRSAIIGAAVERFVGGNPIYDKTTGNEASIAEWALQKVLGNDGFERLVGSTAARIARQPLSVLGEAVEEVVEEYANPLADTIDNALKGNGLHYETPDAGTVAMDALGGAFGALAGQGANYIGGQMFSRNAAGPQTGATQEQTAAPAAAQRTGIDADISNIVDTALGVKPAENGDVEAIAQRAVDNAVAEEAPVEAPAAEPAAPMTLEEREADVQARLAAWQAKVEDANQRFMNGAPVTEEEWTALTEEGNRISEDDAANRAERQTQEAVQLGEQRAADGKASAARGEPENHIDNRSLSEVGNTRIKAFQFDHPELHQYYAEAAEQLLKEIASSKSNEYRGYVPGRDGKPGTPYMKTLDSRLIQNLKGRGIGSLTEIAKACEAIINDNGQENYAVAKRVEMFLDDMLTNGYNGYAKYDNEGNSNTRIEPNQEYIDAKSRITGAKTEWQKYLEDSSLVLALGEVTEEQLAQEFIAEHPDLAWQVTGEPDPATLAQQATEETAGAEAAANAVDAVNAEAEAEPIAPVDVQTEQELPGTRPTMPEPTLPPVRDGRSGIDWENRFQTEQATPMPEGMRQSKSYETVKNAEPTSEAMQSIMDTEGFQSIARYAATTNQADVDNAIAYLRKNGYTASMDAFIKDANAGNSGAELVARGALLLKVASDMGRMRDFADLYVAYKTIGTRAGQTTQAFKIYQKLLNMVDGYALNMTPQDKVYLMRKSVAEYNAEIPNKKHLTVGQRGIQLELDEGLVQQFLNAQTDEQRAEIQQAILDDLGQQAPSSWVEKLNSWRYFSMLFNPRTHIRNMASNAVSWPVVLVKDKVAQAMERILISEPEERTKASLDFRKGSQDRVNLAYASQFYDNFLRDDAGSKWYDENGKNEIDRNKTIFKKFGLLEKGNRANSNLLDVEDVISSRPAFAIAFARECKVQGITAEDIETGRADAGTVQGMIERAQRYSQEMVFRESSKLAKRLQEQAHSGGVWGTIVDMTLPFKRTPANILTRGWQYSPMGLAQGILEYNTKVERGEMTAAQAVDNIAKGVTGTALMSIGAMLAATGFLTGGGSDDDKQDAFDTLRGQQDYSFKFGNHYISAENFGFEAIPLLLGATIYEQYQNARGNLASGEGESGTPVLDAIVNGALNMTQPVMETTMLSTINNLFTDLQYSNGKWVQTLLTSLGENFLNQFFPTIGGATERTFLENRRESTFTDRTGGGSFDVFGRNVDASDGVLRGHKDAQYETGYILNRIPGVDYNQIPYLDAWGREQDSGSLLERFINNFFNPTNVSENRDAGVEDELQRLYDAGFDGVFPERASQSTKVNQHYLTADEYVTYQQTLGQESLAGLESLMSSDDWSTMSDADKAASIEAVYKAAKDTAKQAVDPDTEINSTTQAMYDAGVSPADWTALNTKMTTLPPAGSKVQGWQKLLSVYNSDLTDEQKDAFYHTVITSDNVWKEYTDILEDGGTMVDFVQNHGYSSYQSGSQYYVGG